MINGASSHVPTAMAHIPDLDFYLTTYAKYVTIQNFSTSGISDMSYAVQPVSAAAVKAGQERGGNALGLAATSQNWFNSVAEFTDPSNDAAGRRAVAAMQSAMTSEASKRGLLLDFEFMNDASWPLNNPLASYGSKNLQMLEKVAEKYDPARVFQTLQGGGFKVEVALAKRSGGPRRF